MTTLQNVLLNQIQKITLAEKIDDFLKTPKKISNKKLSLIKPFKPKFTLQKQKLKTNVISLLTTLVKKRCQFYHK